MRRVELDDGHGGLLELIVNVLPDGRERLHRADQPDRFIWAYVNPTNGKRIYFDDRGYSTHREHQ